MKKLGLSTRVFIGFGLGILLGVIFGEKILVIKIIGDIFLKLIKMLTVPLVFFSIILCDYLNCAVIVFVMYFLILKFIGKVKFPYFMRKILPLWAMTAATTSSSGSLPVTMRITRDDFKVEEELYGFSLPLGATINMNAGGAYYSAAVVFAAQIYGVPLTLTQEITIVILATLISVGSPGIPGGGIVMTIMLLTTMGLPVDIMGMIAGIYKIIDIAHTTINCTGDVVSTIAVARSEGMIHDEYSEKHTAA